jgi:hypothetical protein
MLLWKHKLSQIMQQKKKVGNLFPCFHIQIEINLAFYNFRRKFASYKSDFYN